MVLILFFKNNNNNNFLCPQTPLETRHMNVRGALEAAQRMHVNGAIGTHSCPSQQSPRPRSLLWRDAAECHCGFLHIQTYNLAWHLPRLLSRVSPRLPTTFPPSPPPPPVACGTQTWRSGGWRRWTPAGQRVDPLLKTAIFISPHPSQTATGLWTSRPTPRRCITTRLWLIPAGRCPET